MIPGQTADEPDPRGLGHVADQVAEASEAVDWPVWLSVTQMAELFRRDKSLISRHLRNTLESGELVRKAVVAENATTAADGKHLLRGYTLDERRLREKGMGEMEQAVADRTWAVQGLAHTSWR